MKNLSMYAINIALALLLAWPAFAFGQAEGHAKTKDHARESKMRVRDTMKQDKQKVQDNAPQ